MEEKKILEKITKPVIFLAFCLLAGTAAALNQKDLNHLLLAAVIGIYLVVLGRLGTAISVILKLQERVTIIVGAAWPVISVLLLTALITRSLPKLPASHIFLGLAYCALFFLESSSFFENAEKHLKQYNKKQILRMCFRLDPE